MDLHDLNKMTAEMGNTAPMPVLFLGHGSPMNAIAENEFVASFRKLGNELVRPNAILCISAHWETQGTYVTAMRQPPTIHDFGGFPQALYDVRYPAPGSPELALQTKKAIRRTQVQLDHEWGLDHGAWSVIRHLYPQADIPVVQMSIDRSKPPRYHYELAQEISRLRKKGVLIIGSGNMVHNLRRIAWDKLDESYAFDWALEASEKMKAFILGGDHQALIDYRAQGRAFDLAIPTPEHYMPLLYALALKEGNERISLFNDKPVAGSLYMTSVKIEADL
ncbi:4,5-DOPA-extradiol-dioxygenase [Pseudozobellia thermophila]|uniref:Aromatic ring-opening dioxygenase, catalytic subunit, LigB family n=1 Tax=Pseudozobellia thermophila TaxID=192903 RepID=A0A1M6NSN0_9FLAO|nr:4,5-DOPA dioxygenase extradiol [Pseudozobellia thermophila]SHJ98684.1 Aromatic ring-opening dioxygenase, catalytic subunit, LigB family [Pseudozobellia thermophila]